MELPAQDRIKRVVAEHGLVTAITIVSILSAVVGLFVDTNSTVSVKWMLATFLMAFWAIMILLHVLSMAFSTDTAVASELPVIQDSDGGQVLVVGGASLNATLASTELYDPASGSWSASSSLF